MFVQTPRCAFVILVALLVSACSGVSEGTSTPAAPAQSDAASPLAFGTGQMTESARTAIAALASAPDAGTPARALFKLLTMHPDKSSMPWLMNFVASGPAQGGVPCIGCVQGAQTNDNVGITGPQNYVSKGAVWQYTIAFTNIAFTGSCKLAWAIASGKTVVDSFSLKISIPQAGGYIVYAQNRPRPKFSGSAVLTGEVTCGKGPSQMAQAPMVFQ